MDTFTKFPLVTDLHNVLDQFENVKQTSQEHINKEEEDDLISYLALYTQSPLPSPSFFSYSDTDGFDTSNRATVDVAYSDSDATPSTPLTPFGRSHLHFWFPDVGQEAQSQQHQQQQQQHQHHYHQSQQQNQKQNQQQYRPKSSVAFSHSSETAHEGHLHNAGLDFMSSADTILHSFDAFDTNVERSSVSFSEYIHPIAAANHVSPSTILNPDCQNMPPPHPSQTKHGKTKQSHQTSKRKNTSSQSSNETKKTPGRKKCTASSPVELHKQRRLAANARERKRMRSLNVAFDKLRKVVPSVGEDEIFSKYDTLQMAQTYINPEELSPVVKT